MTTRLVTDVLIISVNWDSSSTWLLKVFRFTRPSSWKSQRDSRSVPPLFHTLTTRFGASLFSRRKSTEAQMIIIFIWRLFILKDRPHSGSRCRAYCRIGPVTSNFPSEGCFLLRIAVSTRLPPCISLQPHLLAHPGTWSTLLEEGDPYQIFLVETRDHGQCHEGLWHLDSAITNPSSSAWLRSQPGFGP